MKTGKIIRISVIATAIVICINATIGWFSKEGIRYRFHLDGFHVIEYDRASSVVTIPDRYMGIKVTEVEDEAISNCFSLKTVVVKEGVEKIGEYAFSDCPQLTSVILPESLEECSPSVFNRENENILIVWCKNGSNVQKILSEEGIMAIEPKTVNLTELAEHILFETNDGSRLQIEEGVDSKGNCVQVHYKERNAIGYQIGE